MTPAEIVQAAIRSGALKPDPGYVPASARDRYEDDKRTPKDKAKAARRKSEVCAAAGRAGGAPMTVLTLADLRLAAKMKRAGIRTSEIAAALRVSHATIGHHLRGPSRAMIAAVGRRTKL